MIFEPVVVVVTIVDHSTFGRPRNAPSRVGICTGSEELPPTNRYVVSQMPGAPAKVQLGMKRAGICALSNHGSPTANVATLAVWTRCVVVRPVSTPKGSFVPEPVRNFV